MKEHKLKSEKIKYKTVCVGVTDAIINCAKKLMLQGRIRIRSKVIRIHVIGCCIPVLIGFCSLFLAARWQNAAIKVAAIWQQCHEGKYLYTRQESDSIGLNLTPLKFSYLDPSLSLMEANLITVTRTLLYKSFRTNIGIDYTVQ
jgi:hypothetical protein